MQVQPHVLSSLTISNLTPLILPIGGGVKLQPGQTKTINLPFVQVQQEMVPRLNRLVAANKVTYKLTVGNPQDIGSKGQLLNTAIVGAVTQNVTRYIGPDCAEAATDISGWIVPANGTLRNLRVRVNTAPGGVQTAAFTIMVNGVASAITCTITGTGTTASDLVHTVAVTAGDRISVRQVSSATSAAADLQASFQLA